MRTKETQWFDSEKMEVWYGIKVHVAGEWLNYAQDGTPFFTRDREALATKRKELRQKKAVVGRKVSGLYPEEGVTP